VKGASRLPADLGYMSLRQGNVTLRVSASMTPAGHGDKECAGKGWDQAPRANRGMTGKEEEEGCRHMAATGK
jgi:hypothetical protein